MTIDGMPSIDQVAAFTKRCYLYWTDRPRWRKNRCAAGLHEMLLNFHDDNHYTAYCRWCPVKREGECWGE
jgi:hypothetical protein